MNNPVRIVTGARGNPILSFCKMFNYTADPNVATKYVWERMGSPWVNTDNNSNNNNNQLLFLIFKMTDSVEMMNNNIGYGYEIWNFFHYCLSLHPWNPWKQSMLTQYKQEKGICLSKPHSKLDNQNSYFKNDTSVCNFLLKVSVQ